MTNYSAQNKGRTFKQQYDCFAWMSSALESERNNKTTMRVLPCAGAVDYFVADITTISDYYAFGSPMPGRQGILRCTYDTTVIVDSTSAQIANEDFASSSTGSFTPLFGSSLSNPTGDELNVKVAWPSIASCALSVTLTYGKTYTLNFDVTSLTIVTGGEWVECSILLPGGTITNYFPAGTNYNVTFCSNITGAVNIRYRYISDPGGNYTGLSPDFNLDNVIVTEYTRNYTDDIDTTCVLDKNGYRYGFNGMEKDNEHNVEGGNYDFGARIYDSRLGRWLSVDPLTSKYPAHSPYIFALNHPILFNDPDGKEIAITTIFNLDGTKTVNIVVTAKIINNSSECYTDEQMAAYASRSAESLKDVYSINEPGVTVNVSVDLTVAKSEEQINSSDHVIRLVDDGKIPAIKADGSGNAFIPKGNAVGATPIGGNVIYISTKILDRVPATEGEFAGTGKASGGINEETGKEIPLATLERTLAHEFGHSAGILKSNVGGGEHPAAGSMDGNLMHQTSRENAGLKVTKEQITEIQNNANSEIINNGQQEVIVK